MSSASGPRERARLLATALAAAWIIGLGDGIVILASAAQLDSAPGSTLRALLAALTYSTLAGSLLGACAAALFALNRTIKSGERRGWRRALVLVHPVTLVAIFWSAVAIGLASGPGISASRWQIPVLAGFLVVGIGGLIACHRLYCRLLRQPSPWLLALMVAGLLVASGLAYATGFFYPNSYDSLHLLMLFAAITAVHMALFALTRAFAIARPRRVIAAVAICGAASLLVVWLLPLTGAGRALAYHRAQIVRHAILQPARLFTTTESRAIARGGDTEKAYGHPGLPPCIDQARQPHDIILVSIDALRADRLGVASPSRKVMGNIDRLGQRGLVFTSAYAPSPATSTSLIPLVSGYSAIALRQIGYIPSSLASELARLGYRTISFNDFRGVSHKVFPSVHARRIGFTEVRKGEMSPIFADEVIELVRSRPTRPFFVYAHLIEPHMNYDRRPGFDFGIAPSDRYDSEVAFVDHHLGRIIDELDRSDRARRTIIAVAADHAEAFNEHGLLGHTNSVYDEMVRVPLVIAGPGIEPAVVETRVSLLDVAPTLLAMVGCGWSMAQEGRPLWANGKLARPSSPVLVHQYNGDRTGPGFVRRVATIVGDDKLIEDLFTDVAELYRLDQDPAESKNLITEKPDLAQALRQANLRARQRMVQVAQSIMANAASGLRTRIQDGSDGAADEALVRILAAPDAPEAIFFVDALGRSPDPGRAAILGRLMARKDLPAHLLRRAVRALAKDSSGEPVDWMQLAVSPAVAAAARVEVITILAEQTSEQPREDILQLFGRIAHSDPDPGVAVAAAAALCRHSAHRLGASAHIRQRFPTPSSLSPLPVERVRNILDCLGVAPTDADVDWLLALYNSPVARAKASVYATLEALGGAQNDRPLDLLERVANDRWDPIRRTAIRSISKIATPRAIAYIERLATSQRPIDLDSGFLHTIITRHAKHRLALSPPAFPAPFDWQQDARARLPALAQAIADSSATSRDATVLLALHLRRSGDPTGGRFSVTAAKKAVLSWPLERIAGNRSSIIYLPVSEATLDMLSVSYAGAGQAALQITAAELLVL